MHVPTLELVKESKIYELLSGSDADARLEASGVRAKDGFFYVIFDNSPNIVRLGSALSSGDPANVLLRHRGESAGFEDLTYHEGVQRYLIIIEALPYGQGLYKPKIEEYDPDFHYLESNWVDFALTSQNKGLEGLTYVRRDGQDYVLGLCEGNKCQGGKAGQKPGGGRIQLFQKGTGQWNHVGVIKLPKAVQFEDYASMDIEDNRLAVVSQMSSTLWIGAFQESSWNFVDNGAIYQFPRNKQGKIIYCNIEGISWITPSQIVVVSDKRKAGEQSKKCNQKDQSIHIFNIPPG